MDPTDQVPPIPTQRRPERPILHSETRALTDIIDRLTTRFPLHSRATVAEIVSDAHRGYDDSDLRDFIPLLVEREASRKLEHTTTQTAPTQAASTEPSPAGVE